MAGLVGKWVYLTKLRVGCLELVLAEANVRVGWSEYHKNVGGIVSKGGGMLERNVVEYKV